MTVIAYNFRIGVSTARQIILDVCTAIWDALASIHLPVPSKAEWHSIAEDFYVRWNFPNSIGAFDGKHIMIQCPSNSGSLFFNYKSYFSIVLLAVTSADYRFVMVDIGAYGSSNDSGVLNNTALFKCLKKKKLGIPQLSNFLMTVPHVLLGDEAFPLCCDLMRPFARNVLTNERCIFNYRLSRARKVVEIAFGILANRWRIFHRRINLNPDNVTTMVKAAVVLHNILTVPTDKVCTEVIDRAKIFDEAFQDLVNVGSRPATAANDVRNYFTDYFTSDAGSVAGKMITHMHSSVSVILSIFGILDKYCTLKEYLNNKHLSWYICVCFVLFGDVLLCHR